MRKSLVRFRHAMRIFLLLESPAFTLARCDDLAGQFLSHAATIPFAAEADQPLHAQGDLPVRTNFGRDLESSATDPAAAYFYGRSDVGESPFPNIVSFFIG